MAERSPKASQKTSQVANWLLFVLVGTVLLVGRGATAQESSVAQKRMHHLQRGIGLSDWLTESNRYSLAQLRTYVTPGDIEHIHQLGFDHVRIAVGPELFNCPGSWDACERVQILDQVVQKALSLDLAVILDFHPDTQYAHQLVTSDPAVTAFFRLWAQIADHYGSIDQDRIFFEVMNEFDSPDHYRWSGILQDAVRVIRLHAPSSTIIVSGAMFADIWDLVKLPTIPDSNLIYNFHYYEPHIFTHQGAWWSTGVWHDLHNVPFPSSIASVSQTTGQEDDDYSRWMLLQYAEDHWDANHIEGDITFAAEWARKRNVPLICDEFGAYRNFSKPEDRERWITAVRTALEKNKIGWAMWDYEGGFGVVYKENGTIRDDDSALRGLGLKK